MMPVTRPCLTGGKHVLTIAFDGSESVSESPTTVKVKDTDVHLTMADPHTAPTLKQAATSTTFLPKHP